MAGPSHVYGRVLSDEELEDLRLNGVLPDPVDTLSFWGLGLLGLILGLFGLRRFRK